MTPGRCVATASLLGAVWGCTASNEPMVELNTIKPNMAYNDAPLPLSIQGKKFRPTYRFDTMAGATETEVGTFSITLTSIPSPTLPSPIEVALDAVVWNSPTALAAMLPAHVPAGAYDVVITDPRGQRVALPQAFTSLGPDDQPPTVTLLSPAPTTIVAAGTTITVTLLADDGFGFLDTLNVKVSTDAGETQPPSPYPCPVERPTGYASCSFSVTVPAPASELDTVVIEPTATDTVGRTSTSGPFRFRLAPRPSAVRISPDVGPSGGGTEIVIEGTDFVTSTDTSRGTELIVDGVAVVPRSVTPTRITALTPPHEAGYAKVSATTGTAQTDPPMYFEYVAAPIVRMVSPTRGPVTGGTRIAIAGNHFRDQVTKFYVTGNTELEGVCFVSSNRVEATMPAVSAPGLTAIVAYDPIGGTGLKQDAFLYDPAEPAPPAAPESPDGGLEPMLCPGVP